MERVIGESELDVAATRGHERVSMARLSASADAQDAKFS
jgi:hypothetical protein